MDTDPSTPIPRRFSIRLPRPLWIGLATVVLCVFAAGLRIGTTIYRQHVAFREIERVGGSVSTDPRGPEWLRDRRYDRRLPFDIPHWVSLGRSAATDATLIHVGRLTELKMLQLDGTPVTDAGLKHLRGIAGLELLSLGDTQVTDAGLEQLKRFTSLRSLGIDTPLVTDAGLLHLSGCTHLELLGLSNTQVTDAGLRHLKGLTELRKIWLHNTAVTDAGAADLKAALPDVEIELQPPALPRFKMEK